MLLETGQRKLSAPMKWPAIVMSFASNAMRAPISGRRSQIEEWSTNDTEKPPGVRAASVEEASTFLRAISEVYFSMELTDPWTAIPSCRALE
ncbi:hypothetical protein N7468_010266 [Penicillium chermesinum]|uniref:Uncharacterized protein n=1 Tax=Penicillium chermesinum TaxID=63820 RepID=A0A9W9NCF6_9EURO|nr:uncharacterized protein N7468_010266 [Penicillium chermesinum]KAJ5217258.1 hypothetical protein N7468_010266 [Penicillium chermesinum]KAJ6171127.1 hypothetical protein N7470_000194 [Penicillium chermesinum]